MYTNNEEEQQRMIERAIERYKDLTIKMNTISNYIANRPEESDSNAILDFILKNLKELQKLLIARLTGFGVNVEEIDITESE